MKCTIWVIPPSAHLVPAEGAGAYISGLQFPPPPIQGIPAPAHLAGGAWQAPPSQTRGGFTLTDLLGTVALPVTRRDLVKDETNGPEEPQAERARVSFPET